MGDAVDVAIIGGSFAGLAAALQLGRASRRTLVLDAGAPRNRFSPAAHGVPGWDGITPAGILARFRADVAAYPSVGQQAGEVTGVARSAHGFTVQVAQAVPVTCRRIVLAHGVREVLPEIPGLADNWGRMALHCPYCHGYEVRGRPLAVLATGRMSGHQARMLRADWSDAVTLFVAGVTGLDEAGLAEAGVGVGAGKVDAVQATEDGLALALTDGETKRVAALFFGPCTTLAGSPADLLGCALADGPMGPYVSFGPMAQTSVPGVFAAGDLAGRPRT